MYLLRATPSLIEGYVAIYDVETYVEGAWEYVSMGAFRNSVEEIHAEDVHLPLVNEHDPQQLLATTMDKTLTVDEDRKGLHIQARKRKDATEGTENLWRKVVKRGVIGGSFRSETPRNVARIVRGKRVLEDIYLHDVTITRSPAYKQTEVVVRSKGIQEVVDRAMRARAVAAARRD